MKIPTDLADDAEQIINDFKEAKRADIDQLLLDKLPDVLDDSQKRNKVKNLLQALRSEGFIGVEGRVWRMIKNISL